MVARYKPQAKPKVTPEYVAKAAKQKQRAEHHRKEMFISHYLKKPNATQAAILCGYPASSAGVQGSTLLKDNYVKTRITNALERMQANTEVHVEKVIIELAKIGFANMGDYFGVNAYGEPEIDLSGLDPDQKAAISEIITETYMEGHGDDARPVKRVRVKLHDKGAALERIARILGAIHGGRAGGVNMLGDGDEGPAQITYTLNIGNANILVTKDGPQRQPHTTVIEAQTA